MAAGGVHEGARGRGEGVAGGWRGRHVGQSDARGFPSQPMGWRCGRGAAAGGRRARAPLRPLRRRWGGGAGDGCGLLAGGSGLGAGYGVLGGRLRLGSRKVAQPCLWSG